MEIDFCLHSRLGHGRLSVRGFSFGPSSAHLSVVWSSVVCPFFSHFFLFIITCTFFFDSLGLGSGKLVPILHRPIVLFPFDASILFYVLWNTCPCRAPRITLLLTEDLKGRTKKRGKSQEWNQSLVRFISEWRKWMNGWAQQQASNNSKSSCIFDMIVKHIYLVHSAHSGWIKERVSEWMSGKWPCVHNRGL